MLHGTPTPAPTHLGRLTTRVLATLIAVLVALSATPAMAITRTADIVGDADTVRLVRLADGTVRVERGLAFHTAAADAVLVEEQDVTLRTTLVDLTDALTPGGVVDDLHRGEQWGLDLLEAESVWRRADGTDQVIAIVDSGVDGRHPDLRRQLVEGFSATGADELVDGHGHGTHVAGTAAATAGNDRGIAGLAHAARIMPIQVTDAEGLAYASDVAEGLIWAVDHGATVANLSLAGTQESQVLNGAIDYAIAQGVVVVVAAGNEHGRGNPRTYPASHPGVIAVGAVRDATTRSSFSSTGDWVDVMAPGSAIISARPGGAYGYASGTSMASPTISATVALLRSAAELTPAEVADLLASTATDLGRPGRDDDTGHGLVDVQAALDELGVDAPAPVELPDTPDTVEGPAPQTGDFSGVTDHTLSQIDDDAWLAQGWGV